MAKIVEFNIPTVNGVERARGMPVWLMVGKRKIKFMLQYDSAGKATYLTHFASGCKFGALDSAHVELMCKLSPYHRFTKKELAEFLIDKVVSRHGVDFVLKKIDQAPVINGKPEAVT
jgi:hypothetical protein